MKHLFVFILMLLSVAPAKTEENILTKGINAFQQKQDAEAQKWLSEALLTNPTVEDYIHYFLAQSYQRSGDMARALVSWKKVAEFKPNPQIYYEARYHLGVIALEEKKWREAAKEFQFLKKRLRNNEKYPNVVYGLLRAERAQGRGSACQLARELYTKYPASSYVHDWGIDLSKSQVDGRALGCSVSFKDKQLRIRRLQLAGESGRALQELEDLKKRTPENLHYEVDAILANHMLNDGHPDEAVKLLMTYAPTQGMRPGYLLLLAKAAARAGDYTAAIGAYYKVYQSSRRSKAGRNALFQAAFMSYQSQDYDGAAKKFEELIKVFPGSGLSRDARWHVAWIRYLRGDYKSAYAHFQSMSKSKRSRRSRGETYPVDRVRYWMAVSLIRMGRPAEARPLLQSLSKDASMGYYAVASLNRLASLPTSAPVSEAPPPTFPMYARGWEMLAIPSIEDPSWGAIDTAAALEDEESEETLVVEGADGEAEESEKSETTPTEVAGDEDLPSAGFKAPTLARRFERARVLKQLGLVDLARYELLEIEKHTRGMQDRRQLIVEYPAVLSYYRSSYISETYFGAQRLRGGFKDKDARQLWEAAYPRAFESVVATSSKSLNVPEELVWGIMRAESHYRQDAQSPVGALGLMQLMPFTSRQVASLLGLNGFEVRQLLEPETNIRLGARYLQRLLEKFSGSIPLVAASYNAGPHRVYSWLKSFGQLEMDEFIEHIPFVETRNYTKKVVRNYHIYSSLYSAKDPTALKWLVRPVGIDADAIPVTREVW